MKQFLNDTPYLDRLSTIISNAGTACLVAGLYDDALEYYQRARELSGQPIHHIGVDMNILTTRYLLGERVDNDAILKLHRRIVRTNLPAEFDYHPSYIHWTLAKLSDFDREVTKAAFSHLAERRFMDYDAVLEGKESMVTFLARSMRSARIHGRFPGPRGAFIHRMEIFPIIHFSWM